MNALRTSLIKKRRNMSATKKVVTKDQEPFVTKDQETSLVVGHPHSFLTASKFSSPASLDALAPMLMSSQILLSGPVSIASACEEDSDENSNGFDSDRLEEDDPSVSDLGVASDKEVRASLHSLTQPPAFTKTGQNCDDKSKPVHRLERSSRERECNCTFVESTNSLSMSTPELLSSLIPLLSQKKIKEIAKRLNIKLKEPTASCLLMVLRSSRIIAEPNRTLDSDNRVRRAVLETCGEFVRPSSKFHRFAEHVLVLFFANITRGSRLHEPTASFAAFKLADLGLFTFPKVSSLPEETLTRNIFAQESSALVPTQFPGMSAKSESFPCSVSQNVVQNFQEKSFPSSLFASREAFVAYRHSVRLRQRFEALLPLFSDKPRIRGDKRREAPDPSAQLCDLLGLPAHFHSYFFGNLMANGKRAQVWGKIDKLRKSATIKQKSDLSENDTGEGRLQNLLDPQERRFFRTLPPAQQAIFLCVVEALQRLIMEAIHHPHSGCGSLRLSRARSLLPVNPTEQEFSGPENCAESDSWFLAAELRLDAQCNPGNPCSLSTEEELISKQKEPEAESAAGSNAAIAGKMSASLCSGTDCAVPLSGVCGLSFRDACYGWSCAKCTFFHPLPSVFSITSVMAVKHGVRVGEAAASELTDVPNLLSGCSLCGFPRPPLSKPKHSLDANETEAACGSRVGDEGPNGQERQQSVPSRPSSTVRQCFGAPRIYARICSEAVFKQQIPFLFYIIYLHYRYRCLLIY
jgi:hypothetical protein